MTGAERETDLAQDIADAAGTLAIGIDSSCDDCRTLGNAAQSALDEEGRWNQVCVENDCFGGNPLFPDTCRNALAQLRSARAAREEAFADYRAELAKHEANE